MKEIKRTFRLSQNVQCTIQSTSSVPSLLAHTSLSKIKSMTAMVGSDYSTQLANYPHQIIIIVIMSLFTSKSGENPRHWSDEIYENRDLFVQDTDTYKPIWTLPPPHPNYIPSPQKKTKNKQTTQLQFLRTYFCFVNIFESFSALLSL